MPTRQAFFYKKMGGRTYITKEEKFPGLKAFKDCLTVFFFGNTGDFKGKLMLAYHFENPLALKGKNKNKLQLPVFWHWNRKLGSQHVFLTTGLTAALWQKLRNI